MDKSMNDFSIFPAIDLRAGTVVRLKEGDPARQTNYSNDPGNTAQRWCESGASWLHIVNLDGAFEQPDMLNHKAVVSIIKVAKKFNVKTQFGGGIRSANSIQAAFDLGIDRVILGTALVETPKLLEQALQKWGDQRIVAGIDARDGIVMVRGWQQGAGIPAVELASSFRQTGLRWLIFTDIARDGLQTGINLPASQELAQETQLKVIASGGVANKDDILGAYQHGLAGVIVGRALYEGTINPFNLFAFEATGVWQENV